MKAKLEVLMKKLKHLLLKCTNKLLQLNKQHKGAEGAQSADSSNNNGDDVVDGEFTENN